MNNIDALDLVGRIENKFSNESFFLKEVNTKLIFRHYIFLTLISKSRDSNITKNNNELWKKALKKIRYVIKKNKSYLLYKKNHAKKISKDDKIDILLFSSIWYRRVKVGENYYNPFTDPIIDYLEKRGVYSILFEYSGNHDGFNKKSEKKTYTNQYSIVLPQIKSLFTRNISFNEKKAIRKLVENINSLLNDYDVEIKFEVILKRLSLFFYLKKKFEKKLKKLKPKVVLEVCYYNLDGFAMISAARSLGIKIYDIQHGAQGKYHIAYGILDKNLPSNALKPTGYFVKSMMEKKALIEFQNVSKKDVIVMGNLFDNYLREKIKRTDLKKSFNTLNKSTTKQNVLISLQYGVGIDEKLKYILKNTPNNCVNWWIRLHPNMKDFEIEKVFSFFSNNKIDNVEINEPTELPLEILFPLVDLQITHFSSTALDGLNYGVNTILINAIAQKYFQEELQKNELLRYIENEEKVVASLSNLKFQNFRSGQETISNGNGFSNDLENFITRIIE